MSINAAGRKLTINLVSRDNGVGLSADMDLLEWMLAGAGHEIRRIEWSNPAMHRCDVAIFLELWNPRLARYAGATIGVFNLEWFQPGWARDLPRITQLWAKSIESHQAYQRIKLRSSTLTGFMSRDRRDLSIERTPTCLHLRGNSGYKNTEAVIDAWRADPSLPPLTIVSNVHLDVPPYVRLLSRTSYKDLNDEMNRATIHVCPSRAEGWGHYITEALSVGALVISTNASPMNEHVRPEWGILVEPTSRSRRGMVNEYAVSAQSVGDAVRSAVELPAEVRAEMSVKARAHYEQRNAQFTHIALDLLARL